MDEVDDGWVRVGSARNIGEAELLRQLLEAHGIEVRTRGEHLPSIAGELPLTEAQIELYAVRERAVRARELIEANRTQPSLPEWKCPACGEQNPGSFEQCWKCQSEDRSPSKPAVAVGSEPTAGTEPRRGPSAWVLAIVALLAGGAGWIIGACGAATPYVQSPLMATAWNDRGTCVTEYWRDTGLPRTDWCDGDRDGIVEIITIYDRAGRRIYELVDADEDGITEVSRVVHGERLVARYHDYDRDDFFEVFEELIPVGGLVRWTDSNVDGIYDLREVLAADGGIRSKEIYRSADGLVPAEIVPGWDMDD